MSKRKRPSQRRADKLAERERRKRLRISAERTQADRAGIRFAEETTFGVQPTGSVIPVGPAAPQPGGGPANARFTDVLDENFKVIGEWGLRLNKALEAHADVLLALNTQVEEQAQRIRDLENAALGKSLEEMT